jgi:hypothetical protein
MARQKGSPKTGGRKPGSQNRVQSDIRAMVVGALNELGGVAYLVRCANDPKTASSFVTLIGKCLPKEIKADVAATHVIGSLSPEHQKAIAEAILGK